MGEALGYHSDAASSFNVAPQEKLALSSSAQKGWADMLKAVASSSLASSSSMVAANEQVNLCARGLARASMSEREKLHSTSTLRRVRASPHVGKWKISEMHSIIYRLCRRVKKRIRVKERM
jgi:hypothetical protein